MDDFHNSDCREERYTRCYIYRVMQTLNHSTWEEVAKPKPKYGWLVAAGLILILDLFFPSPFQSHYQADYSSYRGYAALMGPTPGLRREVTFVSPHSHGTYQFGLLAPEQIKTVAPTTSSHPAPFLGAFGWARTPVGSRH